MRDDKDIKTLLKEIVGYVNYSAKLCKVIKVDNDICEVEPYDGSVKKKARIKAKTNITGGILIKPKIQSDVLVMFAENNTIPFIAVYSEIESIEIKTDAKISISNSTQDLKEILSDLLQAIINIKMAHPMGPTTNVINALDFVVLNQRLNQLMQ